MTSPFLAGLAADALVVVHLAFILFVVLGGLLVFHWPRAAWLHVPAAAWGAYVELSGRVCPLTPLEQALRQQAGEQGYAGGFIDHYIVPIVYPPGLTATAAFWLGIAVLLLNAAVYGCWAVRRTRRQSAST